MEKRHRARPVVAKGGYNKGIVKNHKMCPFGLARGAAG